MSLGEGGGTRQYKEEEMGNIKKWDILGAGIYDKKSQNPKILS